MIRQARGYFGIDAKAYGHVGHVDLSALKVCIQYTAGAAGRIDGMLAALTYLLIFNA